MGWPLEKSVGKVLHLRGLYIDIPAPPDHIPAAVKVRPENFAVPEITEGGQFPGRPHQFYLGTILRLVVYCLVVFQAPIGSKNKMWPLVVDRADYAAWGSGHLSPFILNTSASII